MRYAKLTLAGKDAEDVYIPTPFAIKDLGDWRDSTARVNGEPRSIVYWGGEEFRVQETAKEILEIWLK